MMEKFKAWLKSRDMTTRCYVMPGDTVRIRIDTDIDRPCLHNGKTLGVFHHNHDYIFEWTATRPFRTLDDAILACSATIDIVHVQKSDYI